MNNLRGMVYRRTPYEKAWKTTIVADTVFGKTSSTDGQRVERLETVISTMSALTNSVRLHGQTSTASLTRTEAERRVLQQCSTTRSREQTCPLTYHTITDDTPTLTLLPCTAHERILQSTNNGITDSGQGQISQFYDFSKCSYSRNRRDVPCLGPHNYV